MSITMEKRMSTNIKAFLQVNIKRYTVTEENFNDQLLP